MTWRLDRLRQTEEEPEEESQPVLSPGAQGPGVVELKRRLRAWYAAQGQRAPRRMRGPVYGPNAVEAVKEIQRANGLTVDGIVGPETWAALPP